MDLAKSVPDIAGVIGYAVSFLFSVFLIRQRLGNPLDVLATLAVLTGSLVFVVYYARNVLIKNKKLKDEDADTQRRIRQIAHFSFLLFLVMTSTHFSNIVFTPYDPIGALAHALILFAITYKYWIIPGIVALIVYLTFATISSMKSGGMFVLRGVACAILLVTYGDIILADPLVNKIWE